MFFNKKSQKKHKSKTLSRLSKRKSSKIPQCVFDKDNKCQSKGSGGHQGTILSVKDIYCAKVVSSDSNVEDKLEYKFLNDKKNQELFSGFIPKFMGLCNKNDKKYLVIENLKYGLKEPVVIDIKVGYQTFNKNILLLAGKPAVIKGLKQGIIDKNSKSGSMGFRAEGMEGAGKSFSKSELKKMKPEIFLKHFLSKDKDNKAINVIINKLNKFRNIVQSSKYDNYLMAGSSMLILYDAKNPSDARVKIIDFANSYRYDKITDPIDKKFNKEYRAAISNLTYRFNKFLLKEIYFDGNIKKMLRKTKKIDRSKSSTRSKSGSKSGSKSRSKSNRK